MRKISIICLFLTVSLFFTDRSYGFFGMDQQTYVITYSCGSGTGVPPASHETYLAGGSSGSGPTTPDTATLNPANNTCTPPNGQIFAGWLIDGSTAVTTPVQPGVEIQWSEGHDGLLIAQYQNDPSDLNTNNPTCVYGTLHTYTGPVDIEANFVPNTINTTWYSNGSQMTVDSAYQTCTYDAPLTPPTPAARPGYTFGGWVLRTGSGNSNETPSQQSNLSALAGSTNANSYYGIDYNTYDDDDYCAYPGNEGNIPSADDCSISGFSDLNRYEWKAVFDDVTVYGTSGCSETTPNGNGWVVGTPTILTESYIMNAGWDLENLNCWCHATAYTQNGGSQQTISSSPWVGHAQFVLGSNPGYACLESCTSSCAQAVYNDQSIRTLMFGN